MRYRRVNGNEQMPAIGKVRSRDWLRPIVNTSGNEWAAAPSFDGHYLVFNSDGHGGEGRQDLLIATLNEEAVPVAVRTLVALNSADDDFDAAFLPEDAGLIFARGRVSGGDERTDLDVAWAKGDDFAEPVELPDWAGCAGSLNIGAAAFPRYGGDLFISSNCPEHGAGRMDIYRLPDAIEHLPR